MNIGKDLNEIEKFTSEWNGEAFSFSAKKHALTPRVLQDFKEIEGEPIKIASVLSDMITAWDVDENGEPLLPTVENLERLPVEFLVHIITVLGEKWQGKKQTPRPSQSSSEASAT